MSKEKTQNEIQESANINTSFVLKCDGNPKVLPGTYEKFFAQNSTHDRGLTMVLTSPKIH